MVQEIHKNSPITFVMGAHLARQLCSFFLLSVNRFQKGGVFPKIFADFIDGFFFSRANEWMLAEKKKKKKGIQLEGFLSTEALVYCGIFS